MTSPHYTRSKARKFYVSESDEGNVEPDDAPPTAYYTSYISFNRSPFTSTFVRQYVEAVREPESKSAEPAGLMPVPSTSSPADAPSSEGGPGCLGPAVKSDFGHKITQKEWLLRQLRDIK